MIKTRVTYGNWEIYIRPETISYIIRDDNKTTIGFTNGHTYSVSASIPELLEAIKNENNYRI